ncbi:NADAR family protein [Pleionea litopenaei]|uniref:NADAR family protein n=1 Tax=Pleionea litopenaei TaxID=3070815 RepID=A0AA51X5C8_9GAMM|nr:NADAR family protein [Pleionea sp. HL-JVS1]WMS85912.1 NADAR family protein [Pleionea sp. HL-JVS1]
MKNEIILTREQLLTDLSKGKSAKYLFFWGHKSTRRGSVDKTCLSQWYPSNFTVEDVNYHTAEHYMMAEKARLFNDLILLQKILQARSPGEAKALGRQVANFNQEEWVSNRFEIVVKGNYAKFSQCVNLKAFLLSTKRRVLVEASPHDKIWGIGLAEDHPNANNPYKWRGDNLLGFALMKVRILLSNG